MIYDVLTPLLAASLLQASAPNVVLVGPFFLGKMRKFQRSHFAVHDRARTEASAQTQEKHLSFLVGAERLHGRVVDDPDRAPKCSFKVKIDPSLCQIVRFRNGPPLLHRSRITNGLNFVLPGPWQAFSLLKPSARPSCLGRMEPYGVALARW